MTQTLSRKHCIWNIKFIKKRLELPHLPQPKFEAGNLQKELVFVSLESNNRPQLNLITWIPSGKMVRFLNRNWTRNSLLKSWIVFLIIIFHWPKSTKTGRKQIASDKNIYFCRSYWRKKKNTNKWRGCCSTSSIPPNLPPPPLQKKAQLQQQQKNTLDVFTLSNRNPITGISFNLQAI